MNRLILVGNGFDLAHGLRTSYCDFLEHYLENVLNTFAIEKYYSDPLISINYANEYRPTPVPVRNEINDIYSVLEYMRSESHFFKVTMSSTFLSDSITKSKNLKWVDLESDYFDALLQCQTQQGIFLHDKVKKLNDEFGYLSRQLEDYLSVVQLDPKTFKADPAIVKIFREQLKKDDFPLDKFNSTTIKKTLYLNFNYTNTLYKYAKRYVNIGDEGGFVSDKQIHIHGELKSATNPMVFGFGDEFDDTYQTFEKLRNDEMFKYIKSYAYLKTRNYHDLIRFLNESTYQVFIIGHSCGISDRTMFREIFEHENCRSIKVFYHLKTDGSNDYTDKMYNLSRHFGDKGMMRKKIVPFPLLSPLPQYSKPK